MSSTILSELQSQIAKLQQQADEIIKNERIAVIRDIQVKLNTYNITIDELHIKAKSAKTKSPSIIKYRKDAYLVLSGRGPKPQWVKTVEAKGETIEQYRVQG